MKEIKEKAEAKLNISLDVRQRREDGFHDMCMIMQTVSLCDEITVRFDSGHGISAKTSLPYIPGDERNLAVKAASVFADRTGLVKDGIRIYVTKNIPVGAGMGGGSADAAAVLRALNRACDRPLSESELMDTALQVGSDVPFCVRGGSALAEGRGEILTPLSPFPACCMVICKPKFSISTPDLFRSLDRTKIRRHPDTAGMIRAIEQNDLQGICRRMYNVFEDVDDRRLRTVSEIKGKLLDAGAKGAIMTGTGSAVFGIFTAPTPEMKQCVKNLKREYGFACTAQPTGCAEI